MILTTPLLAQSVSDTNPADIEVTLYNNNKTDSFNIFEVNGANNDSANPHKIYIPIKNDNSTPTVKNENFSYYPNRDKLPLIANGSPKATTELRFFLTTDIEGLLDDLHVAVATTAGGNYSVLRFIRAVSDENLTFDLSLTELCSNAALDCDSLNEDREPNFTASVFLYFFLADGESGVGASVDPSQTTGAFYQVFFSSKVYADRVVELSELRKGDGSLVAEYTSFVMADGVGDSLYSLTTAGSAGDLCSGTTDSTNSDDTIGPSNSLSNLTTLETLESTGTQRIGNLENNRCYSVKLFLCDRFGFCSYGSQTIQNAPEDIQALLEKQACFFFTAGFGEEHPVVNFFQAFRDQHLRRFWLGRQFIDFYYEVAPQYTPFILERPWLQSLIRGGAYVLYALLQGGLVALVILFFVIAAIVQSRRITNRN